MNTNMSALAPIANSAPAGLHTRKMPATSRVE
jgi:hypothetical protein